MKYLIYIVVIVVIAAGGFFGGKAIQKKKMTPADPVDTVLLKHYGYTHFQKTPAWVLKVDGLVPYYLIVVPAVIEKPRQDVWVLSLSNDLKTGVNVAILKTDKDLEKWQEFLK